MKTKYAFSFDEENYHGLFDTIEKALEKARNDTPDAPDFVYIGEAIHPDPLTFINGPDILDQIQNEDEFCSDWADGWPRTTKEQDDELTAVLRAAFQQWMAKHDLAPTFYNVENAEKYNLANMDAAAV